MQYTALFHDGSRAPVTDLRWSPAFTTGLAHRGDGFARCVFIDPRGALEQQDAWVERVEPAEAVS